MVEHHKVLSVSPSVSSAPNETIFLRGEWTVLNLIWAGHRRSNFEYTSDNFLFRKRGRIKGSAVKN